MKLSFRHRHGRYHALLKFLPLHGGGRTRVFPLARFLDPHDTSRTARLASRACRLRFPLIRSGLKIRSSPPSRTREAGEEHRLFVHLSQAERRSTAGGRARHPGGRCVTRDNCDRTDHGVPIPQGDRRQNRSRAARDPGLMTPSARCSLDRFTIDATQLGKLQLLVDDGALAKPLLLCQVAAGGIEPPSHPSQNSRQPCHSRTSPRSATISRNIRHTDQPDLSAGTYTRFTRPAAPPVLRSAGWILRQLGMDGRLLDRVYNPPRRVPKDCVFFPFSFGPFLGFWVAFDAATRIGCLTISGGGMRSAARLRDHPRQRGDGVVQHSLLRPPSGRGRR